MTDDMEVATCPDCVAGGIIQQDECDTCGACRWVLVDTDGALLNPTIEYQS